ncbi:cobyrinate a,c-diamide synthase [Devosia sp.]|uniref:cobyrinate a,c-diamide synthase n=1 Tax=Devosia sp. TaxID=1871048 RepID=UPI0035B219C8
MNGLVIAAPRSGSGKTTLTLGIAAALRARGLAVAPAKTGPDYIDTAILARVAGRPAVNLDPWAMSGPRLAALAAAPSPDADLLLVEGVMGLFDGAADGRGSTADLAAALGLPVILVLDAERQSQSIAALAHGFVTWRSDVRVAGLIVNRAASARHEAMLRTALASSAVPLLGVIPRREGLVLPDRHLGLVLPDEVARFDAVVSAAAEAVEDYLDLDRLLALSTPLAGAGVSAPARRLPPLGGRIAIARDAAFAFLYPHILADWRGAGAELTFFSPLADQAPEAAADAIFLPGGYPELHAAQLAQASRFIAGLRAASARGALLYGECGGFMVLGTTLTDRAGTAYSMAGLLPHETRIDRPKRVLGYRRLAHRSPLPFPAELAGHEFHYSSARRTHGTPLFAATDALGESLPPMGLVVGRVMGSYAHVIDTAPF